LTAKKTELARKSGGSPTALLENTARGLGAPRNRDTLNSPSSRQEHALTFFNPGKSVHFNLSVVIASTPEKKVDYRRKENRLLGGTPPTIKKR
jgi:hypothetical protein